MELIVALAKSLDSRDRYTANHSENVASYALKIAREMNLSKKQCDSIYVGGLLHDIGKIGVPESILTKPSMLTADEYQCIQLHPTIGYETVKHIPSFKQNGVLDMILYHHERYDGKGYPIGLKGSDIPLGARIMAVADTFDAMTSRRVYRGPLDLDYVRDEMIKNKGSQFDAEIVDVFLRLLEREGINLISTSNDEPDKKTYEKNLLKNLA